MLYSSDLWGKMTTARFEIKIDSLNKANHSSCHHSLTTSFRDIIVMPVLKKLTNL